MGDIAVPENMPKDSGNHPEAPGAGVGDDQILKDGGANRSACTECQRRKQKCNREWPCNNCHKRKVADMCRFSDKVQPNPAWTPSQDVRRKRERGSEEIGDDWDAGEGLEAIGYTASHILASLEIGPAPKKKTGWEQYRLDPAKSDQLKRALDVLPERHIIDSLIQNFLNNVNFYYYVVYPPNFLKEYDIWWKERLADSGDGRPRSVGVQWTCLLLMVCACAAQHTDAALRTTLEKDLGTTVRELTDRYHNAARELHSVIPVGQNHVFSVQYLLHSCYWFKAEARFVECWHVLGSAVREAQMLGLHKESTAQLSEFEREMRRRLWCIVDAWDWLVSALLARPMLIDRADSEIGLPSLTLEGYKTSPLLHMKLQSDLVARIFKRFGPPKLFTDPNDILEYQVILETFMKTFPPSYAFENPDTSEEQHNPWVALHRHYMHTCTLSIALGPFRPFLAKNMSSRSPAIELDFRRDGINYALRLMDAVHSFFEYVWTRDTTFHFVPFCIFDTAALLASAFLHDEDGTIPRRHDIFTSIDLALVTLRRLSTATDTAKIPFDILRRLHTKIRDASVASNYWDDLSHKRFRGDQAHIQPLAQAPAPPVSYNMPIAHQQPYIQQGSASNYSFHSAGDYSTNPQSAYPLTSNSRNGSHSTASPNSINETMQSSINSDGSWTYVQPAASGPSPPLNAAPAGSVSVSPPLHDMGAGLVFAPPMYDTGMPQSSQPQMGSDPTAMMGFDMGQAALGDLPEMWNWQSLDLGFGENPMLAAQQQQQQQPQQVSQQQQYQQQQQQQQAPQQQQQQHYQQQQHQHHQQHQHQHQHYQPPHSQAPL
ncbi:hypothetical protein F5X68DRAFT_266147 [Plectosphaerella plurivora]|uniref:Zn(2)-C6 fungal-type domain-containing protein n=1 Tax=Plectosphaerella plurivora TaxID=936078 RepID=A0A9P8UYJ6_9PEZI|nr:hypothetical protein F5X68DRAFT_266147 [Plectosphaerella plurivora]